ncbi:MAG TPA: FtsX-like permease family protein [Verrucomicrobiae bacterium]|jgi:putative ABC transport system permease protein|nr:FtsX-like permease family protein [Verrucomicrobiae bacterium]
MKAGDLGELALRNLREAVLRNSLTTLGVAVGVASLVAMLSLGVGLQELATKRLSNSGLFDTVVVMPRRNMQPMRRPAANLVPSKPDRVLDDDARNELARLPNVLEVYPQIRFPTEVRYNGSPYSTIVAGVPDSSRGNGSFDGIQGSFFSGPNADEAILQIEFAKDLSEQTASLIGKDLVVRYAEREALPPESAAAGAKGSNAADPGAGGFSIVPREKKLHIVGIVETEPAAGFGGFGSGRLLIPLEVASALRAAQVNDLRDAVRATNGKPVYASLTVRVKSPALVEGIETAVKNMGFGAFSLLDATRNLRLFFTIFDLLLAIFGSLALAVATLGIINTLVMAILERRREIGILKALGAADRDVKQLFFVEAGVMGLFGGALGVVFGWFIGRALTWGTNVYLHRQNLPSAHVFSVPWWLVLGAIAFAVIVSLIAGLYPASRAAKLNPVEALRYE